MKRLLAGFCAVCFLAYISGCASITGVSLIQENNSLLELAGGAGLPNVFGNMLEEPAENAENKEENKTNTEEK